MNWLKKIIQVEVQGNYDLLRSHADAIVANNKLQALEDYFDIEYFNGGVQKPHYRKRKKVVKKLGRPRKNK